MRLIDYFKDKLLLFILHLVCLSILVFFLRATGYGRDNIFLIGIFWIIIVSIWFLVTYLHRRKYFLELEQVLENVDRRYLLGELMPDSPHLEDRLYREMIRHSNKSVIERIRQIEDAERDYREYIEGWVHEVKAPITGIALLCENGRKGGEGNMPEMGELLRSVSMENRRIENYVDMALYYARSEQVYKDYMIRETSLYEVVCEVLERNRLLLIKNHVRAEVSCEDRVYTDRKWIAFICNQILLNSVKYRREEAVFHISTRREKNGVYLVMEDNGTGIRPEELSRIFEKGFTGSNGRDHERATGMGLYLCRRLCDMLGIGISAESEYGKGTRVLLEFPVSTYIGEHRALSFGNVSQR